MQRDKLLLALSITLMGSSLLASMAAVHYYRLSLQELPTPTGSLGDLDGSSRNIISFEDSQFDIETIISQIFGMANSTVPRPQ